FTNIGFYCSLVFFGSGLLLAVILSILHKNAIQKKLYSLLHNDATFFDKKIFTPEEYFNRNNFHVSVFNPPQSGKQYNNKSMNSDGKHLEQSPNVTILNSPTSKFKDNKLVLKDNIHTDPIELIVLDEDGK